MTALRPLDTRRRRRQHKYRHGKQARQFVYEDCRHYDNGFSPGNLLCCSVCGAVPEMGPGSGSAGQLLGVLGINTPCDGYSISRVVSDHAAELDLGLYQEEVEGGRMSEVFLKH